MDPLSFTEIATRSLLTKLGSILVEEAALLAGVEDDVQYIMDELESMTFFLRALSEKQNHHLQVKIWMKQVRELAYDAEDTIDLFAHRLRRPHSEHGLVSKLSHAVRQIKMLKVRHGLASDLKILKLRARDVSDRRARYDILSAVGSSDAVPYSGSSSMSNSSIKARLSPLSTNEVKHHLDKIVEWLREDSQPELRVISIVDFGGLGKTTLARMAFERSTGTDTSFKAQGWIAVSQSFETKALLQRLAPQLFADDEDIRATFKLDREKMKKSTDNMDESELMTKIKNNLMDKRYLIFLDDIWSINAWKSIAGAFPNNNKGSRIIVTTRNIQVANTCSSPNHQFIYRMPPLDSEKSWELFCKRVFDGPCSSDLQDVAKDILKKCGGLPLAIVTIAGVLASKPSKTKAEWEKFLGRMNFELDTNKGLEGIKQILTLSYDDLPYYLKPCLLYLSTFPEDYEISRKRLVRRWMAEGLINSRHDVSDEEVAEEYFNELINSNLIQPSKFSSLGKVKTCRVHDIMLELIFSQSMDENFIIVADDHTKSITAHGKIRRISFHQRNRILPRDINLSRARSVNVLSEMMPLLDYGKMRLLRVLDMEGCSGLSDSHLEGISKLILLRFLSLRDTSIGMLPHSIGNLQDLQFLDIRECWTIKIPNSIVKLQKLAYFLYDCKLKLPKGIGKMKALQKLGSIDFLQSCTRELQDVGELTNLEHLKLNLQDVDGLTNLELHKCNIREAIIPSWSGQCLTRRGQHISSMKRKSMQICASLEKLHKCLRSLRITDEDGMLMDGLCKLSSQPLHLEEISLKGQIKTLPAWFEFLDRITKITLTNLGKFENGITLLAVLKSIPTLVHLYIDSDSVYEKWCFEARGFTCLQKLYIIRADEVNFNVGALPALEILFLWDFRRISGVEHLTKLSEIRIGGITSEMSAHFKKITESGHPNHPKVVVEDPARLLVFEDPEGFMSGTSYSEGISEGGFMSDTSHSKGISEVFYEWHILLVGFTRRIRICGIQTIKKWLYKIRRFL